MKKSIRSKIKKHTEQNNNDIQMNLMNPSITPPNQATNASQLHGQNSLRAQLLARAAFAPTLGFTPQQYGNITNERRIDQLRTDNQTINSQLANNNATIESLKNENAKLKGELDESKKMKKKAQKQLDKSKNEQEMAQDSLQEARRIDMETMRQQQRKQNAELQKAEQTRQNNIVKYKTEADQLETNIHVLKMVNQNLQSQYDENKAYQRMTQLKNEAKQLQNENASLQKVMQDPLFVNPNKEIIKLQQEIMKEQYQKELYEKQMQKQKELNDIKIKSQTIPTNELEAYTTQHVEEMKKLETDILDEKEKMRPNQQKINEYQYMLDKEYELNKRVIDVKNENDRLQAQITKLDAQNSSKNLGVALQNRLRTIGQQEVANQQKKRRVELAEQTRVLREEEFLNGVKVSELEKDLPENLQKNIKAKAANEANNEELKKNLNILQQLRASQEEKLKMEAKKEFFKSNEYDQLFKERVENEIKAARTQKEIEQNYFYE